jgi:hypothetical protein
MTDGTKPQGQQIGPGARLREVFESLFGTEEMLERKDALARTLAA